VLWIGFAFWLLGVGLKVNFSRTVPVGVEVLTLIIEGIGIGFVHQPGESYVTSSLLVSTVLTMPKLSSRCKRSAGHRTALLQHPPVT
jgi:hypothetical protein